MPPIGPRPNDAFLSYAHEDLGSVEWLARLLESYWVPGQKPRRIFWDRDRIIARGLDEQIFDELRASRHLIVCCSRHTAESSWVQRELADFLREHEAARVLVCRVGERTGPPEPLPPFLTRLWEGSERAVPFVPDLRGQPEREKGRGPRRRNLEEALALLAPLVGAQGKDEVLARRARRFRALGFVPDGPVPARPRPACLWAGKSRRALSSVGRAGAC